MALKDILKTGEELIEKIPAHIRDIIQKGSLAALAFLGLVAIIVGIQMGFSDAKPSGMQLAGSDRDLFYMEQLRIENRKKLKLIEDIEVDPMIFPSNRDANFNQLGKDTYGHFIGEKDSFNLNNNEDKIRMNTKSPGLLDDEVKFDRYGRNKHRTESLSVQDDDLLKLEEAQRREKQIETGSEKLKKMKTTKKLLKTEKKTRNQNNTSNLDYLE